MFGEENYLVTIIWQHSIQPKGYLEKFSVHHNYIVGYQKSDNFDLLPLERTAEHNRNYSNPDNDPNGPWRSGDVRNALYRRNLIYDLNTPSGKVIKPPEKGWRWSKETMQAKIRSGEIIFSSDESRIIRKIYLKTVQGRAPESIWFGKEVGTTREASAELKKLFDDKAIFDTPKPVKLLEKLLKLTTDSNSDDIVLDFFSGSGTTAEAVESLNAHDGGNRNFIMIQMPETCEEDSVARREGYNTISEICQERIRRSLRNQTGKLPRHDQGLRVFRLKRSQYKQWSDYDGTNVEELQSKLDLFDIPLIQGWDSKDLLSEVLLLEGFPLDSTQATLQELIKNKVYRIGSDYCDHQLVVCLDKKVQADAISGFTFDENDVFVCLDSALSDQDKMQLADRCKLKTI